MHSFQGSYQVVKTLKTQNGKDKIILLKCMQDQKYYVKKKYNQSDHLNTFFNILQKIKQADKPNLVKIVELRYQQGNQEIESIEEYSQAGNLVDIHSKYNLNIIQIITCFNDVVQGLKSLKELGLMHRDIKPQNIIYNGQNYQILDFETVKYIQKDIPEYQSRVGTRTFLAPEILLMQRYSSKCDIWSLGCLLYFLLFKTYLKLTDQDIGSLYHNGGKVELPQNNYPLELTELLSKLLIVREDQRIPLEEIALSLKFSFSGSTTEASNPQINELQEVFGQEFINSFKYKFQMESNISLKYYLLKIFEEIIKKNQIINNFLEEIQNEALFILKISQTKFNKLQSDFQQIDETLTISDIVKLFRQKGIYADLTNMLNL